MKKVYGHPAIPLLFGFGTLFILISLSDANHPALLPVICGVVMSIYGFIPVCIPYLRYKETGFERWRFSGTKFYKWKDVQKVFYTFVYDQVFFQTTDGVIHVVGMFRTKDYLKILAIFVRLIRKHNSRLEIPPIIFKRLKGYKPNFFDS